VLEFQSLKACLNSSFFLSNLHVYLDERFAHKFRVNVSYERCGLLRRLPSEALKWTPVKPSSSKITWTATMDLKGWADFTFKVDEAGDGTWPSGRRQRQKLCTRASPS